VTLAPHVREDACALHLTAEFPKGLLEILPFSNLDLQTCSPLSYKNMEGRLNDGRTLSTA
jgi:hypothetical protein